MIRAFGRAEQNGEIERFSSIWWCIVSIQFNHFRHLWFYFVSFFLHRAHHVRRHTGCAKCERKWNGGDLMPGHGRSKARNILVLQWIRHCGWLFQGFHSILQFWLNIYRLLQTIRPSIWEHRTVWLSNGWWIMTVANTRAEHIKYRPQSTTSKSKPFVWIFNVSPPRLIIIYLFAISTLAFP